MYEVSGVRCGVGAEERASSYSQIEKQSGVSRTPAEVPNQQHNLAVVRGGDFNFACSPLARKSSRRFTLSGGFAAAANCLTDLFCLFGSLFLSISPSARPVVMQHPEVVSVTVLTVLVWIVAAAVLRHYDCSAFERNPAEDASLVSTLVMAPTTFLALVNLLAPSSAALPRLPQFLVMLWPATLFLRLLVFRAISEKESPPHEALIVGTGALARFTSEDLERRGRHRIVGFLEFPGESCPPSLKSRLLGPAEGIEKVLRTTAVSQVFIAGEVLKVSDSMQAAILVCERLGVPFAVPAPNFRLERAQPVDKRAVADGYLHYDPVALNPRQAAMKRLFDIAAGCLALGMLLPFFLVIAVLIKTTSRGPVFFRQRRVGLRGRQFQMLKFRSMVSNAEELQAKLKERNERTGPVFKIRKDPRITRIGRFLRKYSLDELPQLIHVVRGEMSVVGPRPPVPSEVGEYEPWQFRRLAVRPGLTCIWQARADRHEISFDEWMYLDMQYIDHWSLALDFALVCKTLAVVVSGAGER